MLKTVIASDVLPFRFKDNLEIKIQMGFLSDTPHLIFKLTNRVPQIKELDLKLYINIHGSLSLNIKMTSLTSGFSCGKVKS